MRLLKQSTMVAGNNYPGGAIFAADLKFAAFINPKDPTQVVIYAIYGNFQDQIVALLVPDPTYSAQNPEYGKDPFGTLYPTRFGKRWEIEASFKMNFREIWKKLTGDKSEERLHFSINK